MRASSVTGTAEKRQPPVDTPTTWWCGSSRSLSLDATLPKERLAELVADDYVITPPLPEQAPGLRGAREVEASLRQAFPGLRFDIEDVSSAGEKVVVRVTASGRHTGAGGPLRHLRCR